MSAFHSFILCVAFGLPCLKISVSVVAFRVLGDFECFCLPLFFVRCRASSIFLMYKDHPFNFLLLFYQCYDNLLTIRVLFRVFILSFVGYNYGYFHNLLFESKFPTVLHKCCCLHKHTF